MTILDHIDKITVPGDVFQQPANEYWALVCLQQGLDFIYEQVKKCDDVARQRLNPEGKLRVVAMGNDPLFAGIPQGLLTCSFHWYAVTACQYVRIIGAVARRHDLSCPLPHEYVKKVIPEVLAFRDKVAAHFAWTMKRDSDAERQVSVMPSLCFQDDRFYVGAFKLTVSKSGECSDSGEITPWSVAGIHERLGERYWPDPESHV